MTADGKPKLGHYFQFQVVIKPAIRYSRLYLQSLLAIGVDPAIHDIRLLRILGIAARTGAGGEVWQNGMKSANLLPASRWSGV